jgi:cyclic pyranopterin phosphate synthase
MPAEKFGDAYPYLAHEKLLTFEELTHVARAAAKLGVTKLRITGGEPLVRRGLPDLIAMLREVPGIQDLALTTNGLLLAKCGKQLKQAGLDRVTVSLDSVADPVVKTMNGRDVGSALTLEGIQAAMDAGLGPVKVNVVVQKGVNDHTVLDMVSHFKGSGVILRFIEFMDVGNINQWKRDEVVPSLQLMEQIHEKFPLRPLEPTHPGEVAERYGFEDGSGEIGLISSVTQPFCQDCSRLRLSCDGQLYSCLFATASTDIRDVLRDGINDDNLAEHIASMWRLRNDRYSELRASTPKSEDDPKVEMYHIGG